MNHTQKCSSFPHALRTRQFYRRKKPFFEIGSLLFGAARMPQDRPPPTRPPQIRNRTAVRLGFAPSDRGLIFSPDRRRRRRRCRRCRRCRLRVFSRGLPHYSNLRPSQKQKILTFLQLFFDYGLSSIPAKRKRAVLQLLTAFLSRDLRFGTTRQSAIAKKLHPDPIFCFWALEIVSGWHRGAVAVRAAKQKPGISLACMSENDAPPCGPHILEM